MNTVFPLSTGRADNSVDTMQSLLARLHETFIEDDDLNDDLEAVLADGAPMGLGANTRQAPSLARRLGQLVSIGRRKTDPAPIVESAEVIRRADRMARMLGQLVNIAEQRANGAPRVELAEVISRADGLRARQVSGDAVDPGHLRRLALATLDVLEQLAVDDDEPFPTFGQPDPAPSRWSA